MLGWCEHVDHPDDSPKSEGDFYTIPGFFAQPDEVMFLCEAHKP